MTNRKARRPSPFRLSGTLSKRTVLGAASLLLAGGAALFHAPPAESQKRPLVMLDQLEAGAWELRAQRGGRGIALCVRNGRDLIQLRHQGQACKTVVVQDGFSEVVVQYTCPGQGFGRTRIRRETNRLIQLDTQGVVSGRPFSYAGEGRRVGSCHS